MAVPAAKREGVQVKLYSIIYELLDQMKDAMAGLLDRNCAKPSLDTRR
jgi:Translation initiation factor 2 (IF-2; GTPase)